MALPGGNGVMSLIGCRVGHACPWALPADISPNSRTSARHELRRIAFSSGGRAVVRLVRADYVAEAGSTQIGNLTIGNPWASFRARLRSRRARNPWPQVGMENIGAMDSG